MDLGEVRVVLAELELGKIFGKNIAVQVLRQMQKMFLLIHQFEMDAFLWKLLMQALGGGESSGTRAGT
ncbi:MAG: hypothetical protein HC904_00465 [Blastochloris sp.]|nr:hypothetical protein [Blastochloris sp.]